MAQIKAVLFNGPPYSGKDTAADWLRECMAHRLSSLKRLPFTQKFAESLKHTAHAMFGEETLAANAFEDCKDEPNQIFHGFTPRRVYIDLSEEYVKKKYGHDFWAKIFVHRMQNIVAKETLNTPYDALVICSDLGFASEAQFLSSSLGPENILIIHVERDGCSYAYDSRTYINCPDIATIKIKNDNITSFRLEVFERVRHWLDTGEVSREPIYA